MYTREATSVEVHKIKFDYSRVIFFKQINRRKLKLQNRGKPLSPPMNKKEIYNHCNNLFTFD